MDNMLFSKRRSRDLDEDVLSLTDEQSEFDEFEEDDEFEEEDSYEDEESSDDEDLSDEELNFDKPNFRRDIGFDYDNEEEE